MPCASYNILTLLVILREVVLILCHARPDYQLILERL